MASELTLQGVDPQALIDYAWLVKTKSKKPKAETSSSAGSITSEDYQDILNKQFSSIGPLIG
jgi:hypothetical protein